jgi:predicted DCC family thiol-disulfide oxidoreductase YuxK
LCLKLSYDGSCHVCLAEMSVYMRKDHGGRLKFVDISDPGYKPYDYRISLEEFMSQMHAIDRNGMVFRGIDAFQAIWQTFP